MLLQKLQRFMYGRYGVDKLNLVLLVAAVFMSLCGGLFWRPLVFIADGVYIYLLFRMLSRNVPARSRELTVFLKAWGPLENWFRLQKQKISLRKQYKYFKCPQCHQQLRAPRGRGNIEVTCQTCRRVFRTKT